MTPDILPQRRYSSDRRQLFALLAVLALWWCGSWLATGAYYGHRTDMAFQTEATKAGQYVAATAQAFNRIVSTRRGMPQHLARDPDIRRAFARIGAATGADNLPYEERKRRWSADPALVQLNQRLALAAADLGLSDIMLVNAQQVCFAASNGGTAKSYVGLSYAARDYSSSDPLGRSDYRVTIGKQSGNPAAVFYTDVVERGHKLGRVAVRIELTSFLAGIAPADVFLTDRNGVVVLASDTALFGSAAADAPAHRMDAAARRAAYRDKAIDTLDIAPAGDTRYPELRSVRGRMHPVIHRTQGVEAGIEPTIHVFWPFPQRAELAMQRDIVALGVGAGGTLLLLALSAFARWRGLATLRAERAQHAQAQSATLAALREEKLLHETLLNALKDAGMQLIMVEDGHIAYVGNRELLKRVGWSDAQLDARPPLLDIIHPDDRARVADNYRHRLADEAAPTRYELALLGRNGERIEYEQAVSRVPGSGSTRAVSIGWEIGARKRAERDLHLLRRAVDQSSEGFFLIGEEGRFVDINAAACRSLGYSRDELIGMTPFDIDPDITPERMADLATRLDSNTAITVETRHRAKDGRLFPVEMIATNVVEGGTRYAISLTRDISERKAAERRLERSESEFRSLAESSPDCILRYDRDGRHSYLSSNLVSVVGLVSADEAIGRRPGEVWPDGRFADIEQAAVQVVESGMAMDIERVVPNPDGTIGYQQIFIVPERDNLGEIIGTLAFGRDITTLREAERRLTHFIDNLPGLAYTFLQSPDGKASFPFVSAAVEEIYGLTPAQAMGDWATIHSRAHPDDRPRIEAALAAAGRTLTPFRLEARVCRPDQPERWLDMRSVPEPQPDGSILWYGLMLDITERKHVEEALAQREREFRSLADNLPDNVARWDTEGRYLYINPSHERTLGKTCEEVVGTVIPDGYSQVKAAIEQVIATGQTATTAQAVHTVREVGEVNGTIEVHEVALVPECDAHGRVIGVLGLGRNLTHIYRMQDALARSEAEFRALVENSPDMVARYDRDCRRVYANPALLAGLVLQTDHGLNKTPPETFPGSTNAAEYEALIRAVFADGEENHYLMGWCNASGAQVWSDIRLVPERDHRGDVVGVLAIGRDVSERKHAEEALRHSEQLLRVVVDATPDWIFIKDRAHRYQLVNQGYANALHIAPEEFIGKNDLDLGFPEELVKGNLENGIRGFWTDDQRVLDSNECQVFPDDPATIDGVVHTFHTIKIPLRDADGNPQSVLAFARDITDHKRMEAQIDRERATLRTFFDALPDLAWMKDNKGHYLACNPLFERLFGAPENAIVGKTDADFVNAEAAAFFRQKDLEAAAAGHPRRNEEWVVFADDGQRALLETTKAPVRDAAGNIVGIIGIGHDITDRKATEAAREAALAEATRLARLRSAFMAQMSHELRTPLNGILGFAQLIQRKAELPGEVRSWLGIIHDNGEHLLALINQILDFAKIEAGKLTLNFADIRLASFLDSVAATIRVGAEKKSLAFTVALAPDLPEFVRTDALRLRQILLNLLGNAVKFTEQGGVVLRVEQPTPGHLRFEVRDTGPGIAAAKHDSIFEPFEQVDGGTRIAEGTGLGLAISRKLAHLLGGDIALESHPGEGSCFSLALDMIIVADGAETPVDADPAADAPAASLALAAMAVVETCALPAAVELGELLETARQGYLRRIVHRAAEMEAAHATFAVFAGHLGRLAGAYRSKDVEAYLQRCLARQANP